MNAYQASAVKRRLQFRMGKISKLLNFQPKSVTSLAILLFFVIGAFYIVIINVVATKGTNLRVLDQENRSLEGENQRLEVEAARLKSLKVINESATGEVEVGDEAANGLKDPATPATTPTTTPTTQPITMNLGDGGVVEMSSVAVVGEEAKAKPKFVPMTKQQYLPSYSSALAQR